MSEEKTVKVSPEVGSKIRDLLKGGEETFLKQQVDLAQENQRLKEELQKKAQEDPNSGRGILPNLNEISEGTKETKEFDDFPSLVSYLKANDRETYNRLFAKGLDALRTNPHSFSVSDKWENNESCVKKTLNRMNREARGEARKP